MSWDSIPSVADDAPRLAPERLPWSADEGDFVEPPKPWAHHVELTEADVEAMQGAASGQAGGVPYWVAFVAYVGLRWAYEDLPDFAIYALFGAVFVANRLLALRSAKKHYARPGAVTMTISADGIEVSAENFAGHHPWVEIDAFTRDDDYVWVKTRTQPGLHALPLRSADAASVAALDEWIAYRAARAPKKRLRHALAAIVILAALAYGVYWLWDLVAPYLD